MFGRGSIGSPQQMHFAGSADLGAAAGAGLGFGGFGGSDGIRSQRHRRHFHLSP